MLLDVDLESQTKYFKTRLLTYHLWKIFKVFPNFIKQKAYRLAGVA